MLVFKKKFLIMENIIVKYKITVNKKIFSLGKKFKKLSIFNEFFFIILISLNKIKEKIFQKKRNYV